MTTSTSYEGVNSGIQVAQNIAPINANNTNGGLLKDSYRWILDNEGFKKWQGSGGDRLLWIRGDPGKGKTMLLCGIIEELTRLNGSAANLSYFFCQATDIRINNATAVLRGLIYLLVEKNQCLLSYVRARYDKAGKALFEDINAWSALSTIFTDILKDPSLNYAYFIVDALLSARMIVSSRNWPEIIERLDLANQLALILLELNNKSVSEAVKNFIEHKVNTLAKVKKYKEEVRKTIYRTFLWVALVCQNLDRTLSRHAIKKLEAFPPELNHLYGRMIDQDRQSEDAEFCKEILAIMLTVYRPITLSELTSLIKMPDNDHDDYEALSEVIAVCGLFLTIRDYTIIFVY
ncbi:NACHT nucleoside triphosphatase [Penicillium odoratum]|uniref:NACHT nucleoside triphosphatase n=1 Tax=Penicillium odoratum TaxID=1167516 RepID=UPI0025473E56|nr:NACHT nucleoside triphosphatase [Penicillium odoratum]KAJ5776869.1 NACHT nucleoside triphosphatase [Penicillium odoratum]